MPGPWGLLPTGFVRKRFVEIRDSMYQAIRQLWSPEVDLSDDSPTAIRAQVAALEDDMLWKAEEAVFYAAYIPTASGAALDYLGQWLGLPRFEAAAASGAVKLSGEPGTAIPAGTRVFSTDGLIYYTLEGVVIPSSGACDVYVMAERNGAQYNKAPGTLVAAEIASVTVSNWREHHSYHVVSGPGAGFVSVPNTGDVSTYQVESADHIGFLTNMDGFRFRVKNPTDAKQSYWVHVEVWDHEQQSMLARTQTKVFTLAAHEITELVFESQLIGATALRGKQFRVVIVNEPASSAPLGVEVGPTQGTPQNFYLNGRQQYYNWKLMITSQLLGYIRHGRDLESDWEYRARLLRATFRPARATPGAIVSRLQGVFDIRHVTFTENVFEEDLRSRGGLRPKAVGVVVAGGFVQEIAANLADVVATGIAMDGSDIYPVLFRDFGYVRPVGFFRPTPVPVRAVIHIKRGHDFPADGITMIKDAIVAYIGGENSQGTVLRGLAPGQEVVCTEIIDRVMDIPGVRDCSVMLGRIGAPLGSTNLVIGALEIAETRSDLIEAI